LGTAVTPMARKCGPAGESTGKQGVDSQNFTIPSSIKKYEIHFKDPLTIGISQLTGLLTFGRQGLLARDNTHHVMTMAYAAVDCFGTDENFNWGRWADYRQDFRTHVVED
jgi:hypothetical protein